MTLYLGEIRDITIEVIEKSGNEFMVDACKYQIVNGDGQTTFMGDATIKDNLIGILFNANMKGLFKIIFYVRIGQEIRIFNKLVEVRDV